MNGIITALISALSLMIAIFPEVSLQSAREALLLCANILVPSLLPFFICSNLLIALGVGERLSKGLARVMGPIFRVSGAGVLPLVMGLVSGYPCGAATTCRLYDEGSISKSEAHKLLGFTNNSGPLFIISALGIGLYGSKSAGVILYAAHVAGALLTGLVFRFFKSGIKADKKNMKHDKKPVSGAISDSALSIISLCGYVVFFAVLLGMMKQTGVISLISRGLTLLGIDSEGANLLSSGFFEITSGIFGSGSRNLPCISAVISFGGLSVLTQTFSFVRKSRLSIAPYILGKILCSVTSALVTWLLLRVFPIEISVFAPFSKTGITFYINYLAVFMAAFAVFLIFLPSLIKSKK